MKFLRIEDYPTIEDVKNAYPTVAVVVKLKGGWHTFDTRAEYETWLNQK